MEFDYIIVQAGGKGTRMEHLTRNKPKALIPINNLPMLFYLFKKFSSQKFVIIGDYKCDVLEKYLAAFSDVDYKVVNANGKFGTCGGLNKALYEIPENAPFMLIWSDLILNEELDFSALQCGNYIGCSLGFECRWKFENGKFVEERSSLSGVAGMFLFERKTILSGVPEEGEFVKWVSEQNIDFGVITLDRTKEYGLIVEYNKLQIAKCRPFNRITIEDDWVIKEGIDEQGQTLSVRERAWYEKTKSQGFRNLPQIFSIDPLKIERICGKNIYEYTDIPFEKKKRILAELIDCLRKLHGLGSVPFNDESFRDAYIDKTFKRLEKVRDLVPFANDEFVTVNGRKCRNVFEQRDKLIEEFEKLKPSAFVFLHGDCTFSNLMLRNDAEPVLIDPRGYFGKTDFFGDAAYDWAKLYYSIIGNYDQFNLKRFNLEINENNIKLTISSSGWEETEQYFFELLKEDVSIRQIRLIHAIIWLSLTTYVWQDYDSICGAFYNGLFYLEEAL